MTKPTIGRQLERYFKGIANHRRIDILFLVNEVDGITLEDMSARLSCNLKTLSEHSRKLVHAGLLNKNYHGREVRHSLSPYGSKLVKVMQTFSHS